MSSVHLLAADSALAGSNTRAERLMRYHVAEAQGFFGQWIAYERLLRSERTELRSAAWRHFVGEVVRALYMIPLCVAAQRYERREAQGDNPDEFFAKWLGKDWRTFQEAADAIGCLCDDSRWRASLLWRLHRHICGSVLAAGLFDLAKDASDAERRLIVDAVFDVGPQTTLLDMLAAVGVTNEEELLAFAQRGIDRIGAALDDDRLGLCPERPMPPRALKPVAVIVTR